MHDPFASFPISCDWACHISRKARGQGDSAGGTDYRVSVGTPVRAAFDGVLTNRPPVQFPASGNVAILTRSDGMAFYHLHLSRFVNPGHVREGDIIGYSGGALGAPGSGSSTGPHLHVNAFTPSGQIRDIHDYFTTTSAGSSTPIASSGSASITLNESENEVQTIRHPNGAIYNVADQFIKHLAAQSQADISAAVQYTDDKIIQLTEGQFWDIIDAYAIPRGEVQVNGHVWSKEHDIVGMLGQIQASFAAKK